MAKDHGEGEIFGLVVLALLALCIYGGYKLFQQFTGSSECQRYAERYCYKFRFHLKEPFATCVEKTIKNSPGDPFDHLESVLPSRTRVIV